MTPSPFLKPGLSLLWFFYLLWVLCPFFSTFPLLYISWCFQLPPLFSAQIPFFVWFLSLSLSFCLFSRRLSFHLSDLVTAYRTGQYCSKDKATHHILILGEFGIRTWDPNSERKSKESRTLDTSLFCSPPHTGLLRLVKGLKRLFKDIYVWECGHERDMWTYVLYFEVTNMFLQKNLAIFICFYIF